MFKSFIFKFHVTYERVIIINLDDVSTTYKGNVQADEDADHTKEK